MRRRCRSTSAKLPESLYEEVSATVSTTDDQERPDIDRLVVSFSQADPQSTSQRKVIINHGQRTWY